MNQTFSRQGNVTYVQRWFLQLYQQVSSTFSDESCHCFDNFTLSLNVPEYLFDGHGHFVEDLYGTK